MRHGYYLAASGTVHGDRSLSEIARETWASGLCATLGKPSRYDGVSLFEREDGTRAARLVVQDFFDGERFCVRVVDLMGDE